MSDSPSVKLLKALLPVFLNLKGLALDPVHLVIVYDYAQWRKRNPGSKRLRSLLNKVVQHDPKQGLLSWGPLFDGQNRTVALLPGKKKNGGAKSLTGHNQRLMHNELLTT